MERREGFSPPQETEEQWMSFDVGQETLGRAGEDGQPRENQDTLLALPEYGLFSVFDGMGGTTGGAVAAQLAKEAMRETWHAFQKEEVASASIRDIRTAQALMRSLLMAANQLIMKRQRNDPALADMGTTAATLLIWQDNEGTSYATVGHVGDSRIYRLQNNTLTQLTLDDGSIKQTLKGYFYDETESQITERAWRIQRFLSNVQTKKDPALDAFHMRLLDSRHLLTNVLGSRHTHYHVITEKIEPRTLFLLATDGITDNLTDKELEDILAKPQSTQEAAHNLIANALARSFDETHLRHKPDDMTTLLVKPLF